MPEPVQLITTALLGQTIDRATRSPRLRMNHNFHAQADASLHRFLNAMLKGTYVTPHRHASPPRAEATLVLAGRVAFFIFDEQGRIADCHRLGENGLFGVDVEPGIWHSMAVLSESAVIYEAKPGPYAPTTNEDLAHFSPREQDAGAPAYLAMLLSRAERSE
jgi:cupin fold WbuC family metalloprotein